MFCGGAYKALALVLACIALLFAFVAPCLAEEQSDLIEESTEVENVDEKQDTAKVDESKGDVTDQVQQDAMEEVPSTEDRSSGRDMAVGLSSPLLGATAANTLTSGDLANIQTQVWAKSAPNWVWSSGSAVDMLRYITYNGYFDYSSGGNNYHLPSLYKAAYEAMAEATSANNNSDNALNVAVQNNNSIVAMQSDVTGLKSDLGTVKGDVATIKASVAQGGTSGNVTINAEQMEKFVSALKTLNTQTLLLLITLSIVGGLVAWQIVAERWRNG